MPGSNSSVPEFRWHRLQGPGVEEAAAGSLDEAEVSAVSCGDLVL